jgi:hypothetical protein
MVLVFFDETPCNLVDGTSVSEGPVVSVIRTVDGGNTFLWIGTCVPDRSLNIRLITYAVGKVRCSAITTEKQQKYESERVSGKITETKLNSGRIKIIKRSLCNVEVALIRVLNKLSGFSASVYISYPRLGCGVIFIILLRTRGDDTLGKNRSCHPVHRMKFKSNRTVAPLLSIVFSSAWQ